MSCLFTLLLGYKLQRICNNNKLSYGRKAQRIESSLRHSKRQELKRLLVDNNINIDAAVEQIMNIKSITPEVHQRFAPIMKTCLSQICGYRELVRDVEAVRKTQYSSENSEHEAMLLELWSRLMPDTPLQSRFSQQWEDIGFQGNDPKTDFRGMGILGLQNLIYFVTHHTETARQLLSHSYHPQYGYSFAIVGINLTHLALYLLHCGALKTHFYNTVDGRPTLEHFHQVYSYLFFEFDKFWFAEKPRDIMEFNRIKSKFQKNLVIRLRNKSTSLRFSVNTYRPLVAH